MALTKLTTDLIDSTIVTSVNGSTGAVTLDIGVTSVNGSTGAVTLETGTDWQATPKTANFTAVAGEGYFVNTTSAAITVTLPSSPTAGDELTIVDYAGTADTNNITITSSDNINGAPNDAVINYERGGVSMVYVDATQGWVSYNASNETDAAFQAAPISFTTDYLVIAGGAGGGGGTSFYHGGGGGAGGYRNSFNNETSGGGSGSESSLTLFTSTNYLVTVGSGGSYRTDGSNSIFSTITSIGGGQGGSESGTSRDGFNGGSGGGACYSGSGGVAVTSPVTHGHNGGGATAGSPYAAGGGGGAGSAGVAGTSSSGGNGGSGLASAITGSSVIRAGGGGGTGTSVSHGSGGSGGGGNGGGTAGNGTANTGSGGGGTDRSAGNPGSGGSGIVIIRYPNTNTVTIGSGLIGTTTTVGSDKVTTFTAGTGTVSFS